MATAITKTAEEQITCTICLEIFKEPKALPCLHTFCKKCISNYIIEKYSQNRTGSGYDCPICRRHVSVPKRLKQNPKAWVDQLVHNHTVSTMIDAYNTTGGKSMEPCPDHPKQELKFVCVDHNKLICSLCFPKHRRCNKINSREEAFGDDHRARSTDASKYESYKQDMDLLVEQCNLLEQVAQKESNTTEPMGKLDEQLRAKVTSMKKAINELINQYKDIEMNSTKRGTTQALDQTNILQEDDTQVHTIKLPFQGKASWITGIGILPSGKLLLVDHTNRALSVFSASFNCLCVTRTNVAPYDLVSISMSHDQVMLSIPDTRELMRCDVLQDGSVLLGQKLKTNIACKALTSDGRYVAVCSDSELQVFETDEGMWMIILEESYETTKFTYIAMISLERRVFITDQTNGDPHIMCLDFDGQTLWKVTDERFQYCTGICVTGTQLMLASWESGKMFTLSFNGNNLKMSNIAARNPWKIYVSARQNTVCVSQHKDVLSEEDKRTVKVFQKI
ncbi:E3 ubiquitin-protein ligase TRIM62-like [Ylistrum balloti]|uniref:E3 ubiquitin-protein ligase TRIM62-like n=1 Tax=Ylistrum balloti TaxID=509963 RepID=UPI002905F6BF|nr:E3 ubiquitin-protein ligase TRIM62-like [Ylistrum balloti]